MACFAVFFTIFKLLFLFGIKELGQSVAGKLVAKCLKKKSTDSKSLNSPLPYMNEASSKNLQKIWTPQRSPLSSPKHSKIRIHGKRPGLGLDRGASTCTSAIHVTWLGSIESLREAPALSVYPFIGMLGTR